MEEMATIEAGQILECTKETVLKIIDKGYLHSLGFQGAGDFDKEEFASVVKGIYDGFAKAANK